MTAQPSIPPGGPAPAPWSATPWQGGPYPAYTWAAPPALPVAGSQRRRWGATAGLAAIIAAVVLGGLFTDGAIAAPSAGTVTVSGPVTITAAPGWIVSDAAGEVADGIALQDVNAILIAQVLSTTYRGTDRDLLAEAEDGFRSEMGQITFGQSRVVNLGGKEASEVTFSALVGSGGSSGVMDGELVAMVIESSGSSYAILIQVGAAQGMLDNIIDDIDAMAASVEVTR